MRIALICGDPGIAVRAPYGGGTSLRGLARGLRGEGHELELWVQREELGSRESEKWPAFEDSDLCIRSPRRSSALPSQSFVSFCIEQARGFQPDLVIERYSLGLAVSQSIAEALGVPNLLWIHAPLVFEARQFRGRSLGRSDQAKERRCWRLAEARVAVSLGLAGYIEDQLGRGYSVHCIENGGPVVEPRTQGFPGLGCQSVEDYVLGYEGSFRPWHRLEEAGPSLKELQQSIRPRSLRVELCGGGAEAAAVVKAIEAAGIVCRYRGWLGDQELAEARRSWDAAWIPEVPWPPRHDAKGRLQRDLLGQRSRSCPPLYFSPLKEVAARNAGLPLWRGRGLPKPSLRPPRSWSHVAAEFLVGPIRGMMCGSVPPNANAS